MPEKPYLTRAVQRELEAHLQGFPVVVVTGARQTGKSTLVQRVAGRDRLYVTLDDLDALDQAERAPEELLGRAERMTVDEVQRAPELLHAIKREVDRDRTPGRFLLTGSANLHLMRAVSESLAGRAVYLTLRPLTHGELAGLGSSGRWTTFFDESPDGWPDILRAAESAGLDWTAVARRGGYPVPAYQMADRDEASRWFDGYVRTYLERDLRDLSAIDNLAGFQRLMRAAALRLGAILNQADLARDVGLPSTTAQRYLDLLTTSYQATPVEAFAVNRTKRLIKGPKLFWSDTGLAMHLAAETSPRGAHLENVVLNDLLAWKEGLPQRPQILHWRTTKGTKVDFVIEWRNRVLPLEVKTSTRVRTADAKHLRVFLDEYPDLASAALILYTGEEVFWIGERILAVPLDRVI